MKKEKKVAFEKINDALFEVVNVAEKGKVTGGKMAPGKSGTAPCNWTGSDYIDCGDSD